MYLNHTNKNLIIYKTNDCQKIVGAPGVEQTRPPLNQSPSLHKEHHLAPPLATPLKSISGDKIRWESNHLQNIIQCPKCLYILKVSSGEIVNISNPARGLGSSGLWMQTRPGITSGGKCWGKSKCSFLQKSWPVKLPLSFFLPCPGWH